MIVNDELYRYHLGYMRNGKDRILAAGNRYEDIKMLYDAEVKHAVNKHIKDVVIYLYDGDKDTNIESYDSATDNS